MTEVATSLPPQLFFSAFSHRIEKNGANAYFHALRLKPVFFTTAMAETIEQLRSSPDTEKLLNSVTDKAIQSLLPCAINALIENKVLVKDPCIPDKKIISHFRSSIPSPYTQIAYFILTENCNFGCSYCFVKRDTQTSIHDERLKNMNVDTALKGLDFFCKQISKDKRRFSEEKYIIFYGGEPLLNIETLNFILEKIQQYKSEGKLPDQTRLSIITNGSLLCQENVELLAKNNVSIAVSLDGDEYAMNSCRSYGDGSPVYKDVIKGITCCKQNNIPFSLSVALTEQSVSAFDKTMEELLSIGSKSLGFNILLTDEDFKVTNEYNEMAADCLIKGFEVFRAVGIYEDRMMRKVKAFVESKIYLFDCGAAGGGQIVIAPNGQVGICHGFLGSRKYFPTTVDDIDFDLANDSTFAEWGRRSPLNMEKCQTCIALGICGGGCPLNAEKNQGSIWDLDERFCVHAKKTLGWLIWDLFKKSSTKANNHN